MLDITAVMAMVHYHPKDEKKAVRGQRILPGERMRAGDVRTTTDGWEPVPPELVGEVVEICHGAKVVRPAK